MRQQNDAYHILVLFFRHRPIRATLGRGERNPVILYLTVDRFFLLFFVFVDCRCVRVCVCVCVFSVVVFVCFCVVLVRLWSVWTSWGSVSRPR